MTNSEIIDPLQGKYHNPAGLGQDRIGPNHRLLTQDELSKPLPEGAEYWCSTPYQWCSSWREGDTPNRDRTYRIPMSPSDRLRQEIDILEAQWKAKEDLLAIVEEVEKGAHFEHDCREGRWFEPPPSHQNPKDMLDWWNMGYKIRLKPTPQSIPWTLETHPDVACVKNKNKDYGGHHVITQWFPEGAYLSGLGQKSYEELNEFWLQRSGDPAGQKVTV